MKSSNQLIQAQNESSFLQAHYETLQKDREQDPRNAFAARPTSATMSNGFIDHGAGSISALGPMGGERDPNDEMTARLAKLQRKVRPLFLVSVPPFID